MGIQTHLYKIGVLLWVLSGNPAMAAEPLAPLRFIGQYDFYFSGIGLGTLALSIEETPKDYHMHLVVTSKGIINLFTRHVNDTMARGIRVGEQYQPRYYESYYKTKKKPRQIRVVYDENGVVKEELNVPPEDRTDRPEVPHALKDGSYDPLTLLLAVRSGVTEMRGFDVKRLYDVKVQQGGKTTLYVQHGWRNADAVVLSRVPSGGMTAKETKQYNEEGEPPLTLYFSDDIARIPLAVRVPILFGSVTGTLVKECSEWKECEIEVHAK